ncbi:tetratricopeptide repeat protein [Mycobacterium pallens]|uniref:Tetratricopeptide repeat protein n=1 Tax=Mycolicibacterium pallens TaxID=370524 RepID=A0ABX8VQ51_9MYCO|nr:tetratricopeptide repeat protein [Mycolicibacterium pallens]
MAVTATTDIEPDTDAEVEAVEETVDEVAEEPATRRRWPLVRRVLLGALMVALLGGSGFLGWQAWQQHQVEVASREGQAAAVRYAQVLTSIDSNNVDQNFADVLNGATGEFKDMYSQSSAQLRQLLLDNKATARGVVIDSAVKSATPDKVVVLMFVDQTVANKAAPDPRIDRSRVKMTMEKVDGSWRASKVELP